MEHPRKNSSVVVVLLTVGALLLIMGYVGHIHIRTQRRYLVSAVTHQIDSHAVNIAGSLSGLRSRGSSEIEDAVYSEFTARPFDLTHYSRDDFGPTIDRERLGVCHRPNVGWFAGPRDS